MMKPVWHILRLITFSLLSAASGPENMTSGSQEGLPEVEDMNMLLAASDLELMAMATQPE